MGRHLGADEPDAVLPDRPADHVPARPLLAGDSNLRLAPGRIPPARRLLGRRLWGLACQLRQEQNRRHRNPPLATLGPSPPAATRAGTGLGGHEEATTVTRSAAFFDLDKTIIVTSSATAFSRPFYAGGLITRRDVLRTAYAQILFLLGGADADQT